MATKSGEEINMIAFLGSAIQIHKKDGTALYFKPSQFIGSRIDDRNLDAWIGIDGEGMDLAILRMDIDFIKYN